MNETTTYNNMIPLKRGALELKWLDDIFPSFIPSMEDMNAIFLRLLFDEI
jgi:hypothetical protein